jgi:hypothetical protein
MADWPVKQLDREHWTRPLMHARPSLSAHKQTHIIIEVWKLVVVRTRDGVEAPHHQ